MLIADSKKETNIIEYIIYMYQIEDIIRSFQFDIDAIDITVIQKFDQPQAVKDSIKNWYIDLTQKMRSQNISSKGHLLELKEIVNELQSLHHSLMTTIQDANYVNRYEEAKPALKDLVLKSGGQNLMNEIDVAVNGLYGLLVLRLKQQDIGEETTLAMQKVSGFLALLAQQYHKMKTEGIDLSKEKNN